MALLFVRCLIPLHFPITIKAGLIRTRVHRGESSPRPAVAHRGPRPQHLYAEILCLSCKDPKRAAQEHVFKDFGGPLPAEICSLRDYHETSMFCLANLYAAGCIGRCHSPMYICEALEGCTNALDDFQEIIGILQVR